MLVSLSSSLPLLMLLLMLSISTPIALALKRVLVLGGTGFVGQRFIDLALKQNIEIGITHDVIPPLFFFLALLIIPSISGSLKAGKAFREHSIALIFKCCLGVRRRRCIMYSSYCTPSSLPHSTALTL